MPRPGGKMAPPGTKIDIKVMGRVFKMLFGFYPVMLPVAILFIICTAIVSAIPMVFMQKIIAAIEESYQSGDWAAVSTRIIGLIAVLAAMYFVSLLMSSTYGQLMAIITQGSLQKFRLEMFDNMQDLPIKYFDTNNHGDIMSRYTNDIDALRQVISQTMPQLLQSTVTIITIFSIMLYYSVWMAIVVTVGIILMSQAVKFIGGGSAKYFQKQQASLGKVEGYIEEMINGQKVVKVFNHENVSKKEFDELNDKLFKEAERANKYANVLGPILNNLGNILYVIVAVAGGLFLTLHVKNFSISGMPFSISICVPFLNMTKQFTGAINQVSHQVNAFVMGMAGADRVFKLIDESKETDEGYVTLVNAKVVKDEDGTERYVECDERTGIWVWKHPHESENSIEYTPLKGDVRLSEVDFAYEEGKDVLHDITLFAKPGQKIAFVGATGAGKTTITNLINRFYDIADGKIRYDGININKIKKADLRHSLGVVLQDTNLFTGTVMDNIRYGRLSATDEECIEAAKLAGANDFIEGLPEGYDTMLTENGSNLSQGQRQLLSISRVAVADPPVMILDEATSSIDTRTEAIVQKGMDALMKGRTVFVIAHRLSTVKNADAIIVLDKGRIIERGTHEELIDAKGQYYQLYTGAFELD